MSVSSTASTEGAETASPSPGLRFDSVVLWRTPKRTLVHFGPLAGLASGLALYAAFARQTQAGLQPARYAAHMCLLAPVAIIAGSRALGLALDWRGLLRDPVGSLRRRSLAFQGGLAACVVGLTYMARAYGLDLLTLYDCFALSLPLGHAVGRLACLSYGCCHGRPTGVRWAIRYDNPDAKAVWDARLGGISIHPTQLYQSLGSGALFALLAALAARGAERAGVITAAYFALAALGRLVLERFRGEPSPRVGALTAFQLIAVGQLALGVAMYFFARSNGSPAPFAGDSFARALVASLPLAPYALAVALVVALSFGLHGPKVGRL